MAICILFTELLLIRYRVGLKERFLFLNLLVMMMIYILIMQIEEVSKLRAKYESLQRSHRLFKFD